MTKTIWTIPLLVSALLLTGCGGDDQLDGKYDKPKAKPAPSASASASPSASAAADGTCAYTKGSEPAAKKGIKLPPAKPSVTKPTKLTITTNFGAIPITLTPKSGPCAANSFASLAKQKYFDKTPCHRIAVDPGFQMLQCGDPTGQGTGGPGYSFNQQVTGQEKYPAGTIAMANTGAPNSEGSQFFLVYGDTQLPPQYTVFGTISPAGIKVLNKIGKNGIGDPNPAGGGTPKKKVTITSVR